MASIFRIGFSYGANQALTVPFTEPYMPVIRKLLAHPGIKVVWNESFDVPRLREQGLDVNGPIVDGMVMWHTLNSDLPKGLGFASTFLVPDQSRWKHLGQRNPYYNAVDCDVAWQCVEACERLIDQSELRDVWDEQVTKVNSPLRYMSKQGMPISEERRWESAIILDTKLKENITQIQAVVPADLVKIKWVSKKTDKASCLKIDLDRTKMVCYTCKKNPATKAHKKAKCHAEVVVVPKQVTKYGILLPFNPSSWQQVLSYMKHMGHKLVMKRDPKTGIKKPTTDEKAIKILMGQNPDDKLYPLLLDSRELNKLAGTYVGRIE